MGPGQVALDELAGAQRAAVQFGRSPRGARHVVHRVDHGLAGQLLARELFVCRQGDGDEDQVGGPAASAGVVARAVPPSAASRPVSARGSRELLSLPPVPSPVTGEVEARLIALACSQPPAGYARWSLRLPARDVDPPLAVDGHAVIAHVTPEACVRSYVAAFSD
ncbi:hypothetical protein BBK82_37725 [Lentzea guizhouensis]|uniref:Uncharacterized protein n=1 Tax=Lentzea guizhouensis TaxID=1586287 RepID=A0A1B2HT22_9PSEU|nr:hypothetical protein BBK82_37725 [Lentzea guizhouensis]